MIHYLNLTTVPTNNIRTNTKLIERLKNKLDYFGYDEDYLIENEDIIKTVTFSESHQIIVLFIVYILFMIYDYNICMPNAKYLRDKYILYFNLLDKETVRI